MKGKKEPIFIDTNMLVYAFDTSESKKHDVVKKLLTDFLLTKKPLCLSTQVLSEFFVVVTKKISHPLSADEAHAIIKNIVVNKNIKKFEITPATVLHATRLNAPYWDALICATMLDNQVEKILTENTKHFKNILGITPVNPF